ncbi:Rapamycin-insensitive companion of mTOR, N-term-domain-containing protein [Apodospora peruviana]|uniref:Rapamycin-insensitive companion of mTOR, N-term-domain-containing protein n=1 Tax=Apodospora peruviana TaxID=516989 RepID=A0AAE0LZL2_9PEZI|nr:Rapamycin-insensitive companion of mTOR, N-term-domain-containing protein [Apodospora peruviana]
MELPLRVLVGLRQQLEPSTAIPPPATSTTSSTTRVSFERDGLQPPAASVNGAASARNLSASVVTFAPRGSSLNPSPMPGSFSSELRSQLNLSRAGSRLDMFPLEKLDEDTGSLQEHALSQLREALSREMKIKEGSENMLEALNTKKAKQTKEQRQRVEAELNSSNQRIKDLRQKITAAQRTRATPTTPTRSRTDGAVPGTSGLRSPPSASRSGAGSDFDEPTESPTFALAEILQALEMDGMTPDYYVSRANSLVDLFKRHPTLKYDLVWSIFGLRMQVLLLTYRMLRYAVSDVASLRNIRALNTDYLDRKADVEREQALKFVRAFLDVEDGVREISRAIVRTIAAVAEEHEERLRPICIETLAEILIRDVRLLIASGGLAPLHEALADGSYKASESLTAVFLYLLDAPQRRKYLRAGYELEVLFTAFTDDLSSNERFLKQSARAVTSALKTWSGLMNLCMYNFRAIKSMLHSMMTDTGPIRDTILDLLYSLFRIKSPAWATSFLAGRRLTTYGRVSNLKSAGVKLSQPDLEDEGAEQNFAEHYTALLLAIFIKSGMVPALLKLSQDPDNPTLKRKSTLLIGEVLKLSSRLLPPSWSSKLQLLPELFTAATKLHDENHFIATGVIYQISSVSKTLYRSTSSAYTPSVIPSSSSLDMGILDEHPKNSTSLNLDEPAFRQLIVDSNVLTSSNYSKWNWDIIMRLIEGPLTIGKRLEEAIKASKFAKRIMSFYRPFKYKFSEIKSSRGTQKYVRAGCSLMHTLLQSPEGIKYLSDNKLLRQVAECLAQCDPTSGLTAQYPMFSKDRLTDTLCGGYFPMLGVLTGDPKGNQMLDRWRIFNMMYRIVDLKQRPDLIKLMLANFDYSLQAHPRVLLSKALTAGTKDIRIDATNALRKYATRLRPNAQGQEPADSKWAIQLLVTQLYDPEIEVCATAVKILEKACNAKNHLEYIVECRPALDHLGEIGAPLLLRFLSTSIGYHYLDGLDYISNEMDDWFLGRNDSYVSVIEASLARSFLLDNISQDGGDHTNRISVFDDEQEMEADSHVPPHFYRELTRTQEGCKLLRDKGHFDEFAATIRDHGMESDDPEIIIKVKGCLWAVGNVGSMELGAPFLESCDVVSQIVKIAQDHEVMSLRGTAFFVLGLISRSVHGLEILSEHGWDANTNVMGHSLGFCIPEDLSKLFSLKPWKHEPVASIELPDTQKTEIAKLPPVPSRPRSESLIKAIQAEEGADNEEIRKVELDPDPVNQRILELVIDLVNMVLYRRARNELMQIKTQKDPAGFRQPRLFRRVMGLLECHHYRLADRSMVVGMFDKSVLRSVVFEEDGYETADEDEDEEDGDTGKVNTGGAALARSNDGIEEEDEDDSEDDDEDDDEEEEDGDGDGDEEDKDEELESSGDEQRTERQRKTESDTQEGLEADQKTVAAHGCYAMTATSALTAQNTTMVQDIHMVPAEFLCKQINASGGDIKADVLKTGMLALEEHIGTVHDAIWQLHLTKYVLDPVMVSTSGAVLFPPEALDAMIKKLFPVCTVLTPNIPEAEAILNQAGDPCVYLNEVGDLIEMAQRLQRLGPKWVLLKGGHSPFRKDGKVAQSADEREIVVNVLCGHTEVIQIETPYIESRNTHGTGCTLASAIACNLPILSVPEAVKAACKYVDAAIRTAPGLGAGNGPLNHFHSLRTLQFSPGGFVEYLLARSDVRHVWEEYITHPFVLAMGDGTLPVESFKGYLIQDYLYLKHFARANGLALYKAGNNMQDIAGSAKVAQEIVNEMKLHIEYCKKFGISETEIQSTPEHAACTAYTRYILDIGQSEYFLGLQVAMAPCLMGYGFLAQRLVDSGVAIRTGNRYWAWIENYASDQYQYTVRAGREVLERHAASQSIERIEELVKIFINATKLEIKFWEMFPYK